MEEKNIKMMETSGDFIIRPCNAIENIEDTNRYTKLKLNNTQKIQMNALIGQLPEIVSTGVMAQAYTVTFPQGLPHTLTHLRQGGFGTMIKGENGKFVGSASLNSLSSQAAVIGAFTAMSIASGQYFLAQINQEMITMKLKMNEILEFLYDDKKTELIAQLTFIRQSYDHYSSLMDHDCQRIATLTNLQAAKIVGLKNVEFYLHDLHKIVSQKAKDYAKLSEKVQRSFETKESLMLAQQLYAMSQVLEIYFAQNQDCGYLEGIEQELDEMMDLWDRRILSSFSTLKGQITGYKAKPMEKCNKEPDETRIDTLLDTLHDGEESRLRTTIATLIKELRETENYYISTEGNVYMQKVAE